MEYFCSPSVPKTLSTSSEQDEGDKLVLPEVGEQQLQNFTPEGTAAAAAATNTNNRKDYIFHLQQDNSYSSIPGVLDSSCSEGSSELSSKSTDQQKQETASTERLPVKLPFLTSSHRPGETSPSAICRSRKLSTGIVTQKSSAGHPVLIGRPTVLLPNLRSSSSSSSGLASKTPEKPIERSTMGVFTSHGRQQVVPDAARSVPPRPPPTLAAENKRKESLRGSSGGGGAAVAPCPTTETRESSDLPKPRRLSHTLHRCQSEPVESDNVDSLHYYKFCHHPQPLRLEAWSEPAAESFNVRSATYLKNRIKEPSAASAFRLLTADIVKSPKPIYEGLCCHPTERLQQALQREKKQQQNGGVGNAPKELPPYVFAINLVVPGSPSIYHQVSYFAIDNMDEIEQASTPFGKLMNKFIFGDDDDFRDSTFKLIPKIVEGNMIVRRAVGSKPSILGKKLKQYYVRGPRHFELIIDIASDIVAQRIVKLALGYAKSLVVDMMFILEGTTPDTLPERIFGGIRVKNLDFKEKDGTRCVHPIS